MEPVSVNPKIQTWIKNILLVCSSVTEVGAVKHRPSAVFHLNQVALDQDINKTCPGLIGSHGDRGPLLPCSM